MLTDMITAAIFLVLAFTIGTLYLFPKTKKRGLPSPPGPRGLPFIGNMLQTFDHHSLYELSKKYGPLMTFHVGSIPILIVSSARMAKEIFKTNDSIFSNRPSMLGQQTLSYMGRDIAFSRNSHYWREIRKFSTLHLFTAKRSLSFRPIREAEISHMLQEISVIGDSPSKLIDISEVTLNLTSSIISRVAFGRKYDENGIGKEKFKRLFSETSYALSIFFFSDYVPALGWIDKLSGTKATLNQNFKDLDLFYKELIDEHLKPNKRESDVEDFIDILLHELKNNNVTSFPLTLENVKAVLMNIFIGATDSSSSVIVAAMTALVRNREAMKKVQEEIRGVIGKKGKVDEEDIQNLPYLRAVVKEVMRLYPPFPLLVPRESTESCVIGPDADHMYEIKAETVVYVSAWAIGRDPEAWEKPLEFKPERFIDRPDIDYKGQHFELVPFGAGRRGCPGTILGAVVADATLANLLYAFDWELPDGVKAEDIDDLSHPGLVMHRKDKLFLRPKVNPDYLAGRTCISN